MDDPAMDGDSYRDYYLDSERRLYQLRHNPCGQIVHTWMFSFPPNIAELAYHALRHVCATPRTQRRGSAS
jgi:hypothetical protein